MSTYLTRCAVACAAIFSLALPYSPASQPQVRDLELPGWLISLAFPRRADGGREMLLLVASPGEDHEVGAEARMVAGWNAPIPSREVFLSVGSRGAQMWSNASTARSNEELGWQPSTPPELLHWDSRSGQAPQRLHAALPATTMAILSAASHGNEAEGLWLLEAGRLRHAPASWWLTDNSGTPPGETIEQREIDPSGFLPRRPRIPLYDDGDTLWITGLGALHHLVRDRATGRWDRSEGLETRLTLGKTGHSLNLSSRNPMPFDPHLAAPPLVMEWPDALGKERLRVTLHRLGEAGIPESSDLWLRFSGPETLLGSYPFLVDGEPALAVWASLADKLRLRYRPRLHVFPATGDRTRAGHLPTMSTDDVGEARWRLPRPRPVDVNGDGKQDLLLLYVDGKNYRVDAFLQQDDLRFKPSAKVTKIDLGDVPKSASGYLEEDLTGDGIIDLVIVTQDELLLVPGRPASRKGSRLFEKQPAVRIALGSNDAEITLGTRQVDLDGDGRSEFVLTRWNPETESMHLRIIAPTAAAGDGKTPILP